MSPVTQDHRDGVSVVIPTRDRAVLLERTLDTIAAQSASIAEVIVADDGSTDATQNMLRERGVTSVRNPRGGWGAARARNAGLERVSTTYVAFVDSDDLLLPDAISRLKSALDSEPGAPFAFGLGVAARRTPDGWRPEGLICPDPGELADLSASIFVRNSVPSSGALVRTDAARRIGGYDPDVVFDEDHHFWVRLAGLGQPVYTGELVCVHRRHAGNRHSPARATGDAVALIRRGEEDPRLARLIPLRLGVELCEVSLSAVKARDASSLWPIVREVVVRRDATALIVRKAADHWRRRRRWGRNAYAFWDASRELRDWLSTY